MEGVGVLQCRNGDIYEGGFLNNQYDGIGCFRRARGDIYMGYVCSRPRERLCGVHSR
jgi:hypothetical protein